jgi:hypothetical protein
VDLVGAGLAVAKSGTMKAIGRSFGVVRFLITDLGRATVGGDGRLGGNLYPPLGDSRTVGVD